MEYWINEGVSRVILGTAAMKDPSLVKLSCREFPERIVVGIDARDGFVAVEGWAKRSNINCLELANRFQDCGVSAIIYTDINRDGILAGFRRSIFYGRINSSLRSIGRKNSRCDLWASAL